MKEIEQLLKKIYGTEAAKILRKLKIPEVSNLQKQKYNGWYKSMNLYVVYPDTFQINGKKNISTLCKKIPYLKKLGITAIHILPILESPMIDMGFDISDFKAIRKQIGGESAFRELLLEAKENDLEIFIDLVMNHISDQHEWFQKALSGDQKYRNYFLHTKKKPHLVRTFQDKRAIWAEYKINGYTRKIRIIFPDFAGEIPHWTKQKDGYWYYHTFYPNQIDLNWSNPDVFSEFAEIIQYWASKGLNFRLDALPFVGKDLEKGHVESAPRLHSIIRALNMLTKKYSPSSVFLVETCQPYRTAKKYFGKGNTAQAELAYNFRLMSTLWRTILTRNVNPLWSTINKTYREIPDWAAWVNFLRNHDELTLEYIPQNDRQLIFKHLSNRGIPFRGSFGVAGRTSSFLYELPATIHYAYLLLASLPGSIAIVFGDELGKTNDYEFMQLQTKYRNTEHSNKKVQHDHRDINRGFISEEDYANPHAKNVFRGIAKLLQTRKKYSNFFATHPERVINLNRYIFDAHYRHNGQTLKALVNTSHKHSFTLEESGETILTVNNAVQLKNMTELPPHSGIWIVE